MATYAPPKSSAPSEEEMRIQNENARICFLAFSGGEMPPTEARANCGRWKSRVDYVGSANPLAVPNLLKNMQDDDKELQNLLQRKSSESEQHKPASETVEASPRAEFASEDFMPPLLASAQLSPAVVDLAKEGSLWFDQAVQYGECASPEGYPGFFEACAIFDLATVAANRIVIPGGPNGQHTGFYCALVARPGCWAKTTTAQAYLNILRSAGLSWLLRSDQITPQKLLADMSGRYPPINYLQLSPELQMWWRLRLAQAGQGAIYRDELGAFFRSMNRPNSPMADFRQLLLSFDDRLPSYASDTRSWGTEEAQLPYLPVLGSTTFADFRAVGKVGSDDWNDGMLSRFIPITPPPGPALDHPFTFETVAVPTSLSVALNKMHQWLDYPVIDIVEETNEKSKETKLIIETIKERPPAREIRPEREVEAHYHRYRSALRTMEGIPEDLAASYVRLPVKALRVAALFAGIECSSTIQLRHWAKAQELAERWRLSLHLFYQEINAARIPTITSLEEKVLAYLVKHPKSKSRDVYTNLNSDPELTKKAMFNLVQSGDILETQTKADNGRPIKFYSKVGEVQS